MEDYLVTVELKVQISAFSAEDAKEAIVEDLNDLPGATVTDLAIINIKEL